MEWSWTGTLCAGWISRRCRRGGFRACGWPARALEEGGAQTCALNAADEIAVEAFLERRLPFSGIARVIEGVLDAMPKVALGSIDDVLAADGEARRLARLEVESAAESREKAARARFGDSIEYNKTN